MKTKTPIMIVLSLAVAGMMIQMSGLPAVWAGGVSTADQAQRELNESSGQLSPDENAPVSGPGGTGDSDIIGLVTDSLSTFASIGAAVVVLPITLMRLGFPAFFAVPVGIVSELIVGIGVIQFGTGRIWK